MLHVHMIRACLEAGKKAGQRPRRHDELHDCDGCGRQAQDDCDSTHVRLAPR
jgi:hypothetical protein